MRITLSIGLSIAVVAFPLRMSASDYLVPDAPEVPIAPYCGQRYEAMIPDTWDVAERARLAIHGMTTPLDGGDDFWLYWWVGFHNYPPVMQKDTQFNIAAKFMEALPLLRTITGSNLHCDVDQVWSNRIPKMLGPDGFVYTRQFNEGDNRKYVSLSGVGHGFIISHMIISYLRDGNPQWKEWIEGIINRYSQFAVDKGDYAYLYARYYGIDETFREDAPLPIHPVWRVDGPNGRLIKPLGEYYALTRYEPARRLGRKLVNYVRFHSEYFGEQGEWKRDRSDPEEGDVHFHAHSLATLNMLSFGIATGDKELIEYCRKSFEWGKRRNSTIEGQSDTATRIGFFLEYLTPYYPTTELCEVADMITIALKLSRIGAGDYWDDADRWIRNHFAEGQMTSADWVHRVRRSEWQRPPGPRETVERVAERNVGAFFGWTAANDGCPRNGIMHCCTGNGARALYYIWENILDHEDGRLRINLLLNRASAWADLDSYVPYQGRVDLKVKMPLDEVSVRVPEWVETNSTQVECRVNGVTRALTWDGRYVSLGAAKPEDVVTLSFPISEWTLHDDPRRRPLRTVLGGVRYERLVFRGNTLVSIEPRGTYYPLYEREHYRSQDPRWRKVTRFIPAKAIRW